MTPRYPDFLCIGAQWSGTAWLDSMLSQHSDVWRLPTSAIHYFDAIYVDGASREHPEKDRLRAWATQKAFGAITWALQSKLDDSEKLARIRLASVIALRDLTDEWYGSIFACAPPELLCGDTSPAYALLPDDGIKHIVRLRQGIKIIFIMRDPIDRGWSDLQMQQKLAGAANIDAVADYLTTERFLCRSDYMTTIERYRRYIPETDFLPMYFDGIEQQPRGSLATIHSFLGLDDTCGELKHLDKVTHEEAPAAITPAYYDLLKQRLAPVYGRLRALNNPIVEGWFRKHYQ
jgi:hypothetical protein